MSLLLLLGELFERVADPGFPAQRRGMGAGGRGKWGAIR